MRESATFYAKIFGFEDLGERPGGDLRPIKVNPSTVIFLQKSGDPQNPWAEGVHHLAFFFESDGFELVFSRIKSEGIPFGDNYAEPDNMKGPGMAPGAKGRGKSVYLNDPSGNLLQIITY
jgi:catechol 2,3-dioxygenase-like lactoylglutathione lyase family enzyme